MHWVMKMLPNKRWLSKKLLSGKKKPGLWNWENHLTPGFTTHQLGSVQFSHSVVSSSLWPHGLQHTRLPCPSPTPGAYSNSCPLSWWCHPTISSSIVPFSSCLQSFPPSWTSAVWEVFLRSFSEHLRVWETYETKPHLNVEDLLLCS